MKTVLIDDEKNCRIVLRDKILKYDSNINIVGEASGVESGYELILKTKPDLIFLDIQMNDGTGFDLLNRIENRSFKLIENLSHQNFYHIDLMNEKKNIDISQIREMFNYANKSSFNNRHRFVLIDNVENLNINSLNALLKIIEEPNENLFFILIHDNKKSLKETLKSRCITFKLNLTFEKTIEITEKILNRNIFDTLNDDLIYYYFTPGELINLITFAEHNNIDLKNHSLKNFLLLLINENYYSKNNFIKYYIFTMIQIYFLKLLHQSRSKNEINFQYTKFINMIYYCNKFNLNSGNLFMEFKKKVLNE